MRNPVPIKRPPPETTGRSFESHRKWCWDMLATILVDSFWHFKMSKNYTRKHMLLEPRFSLKASLKENASHHFKTAQTYTSRIVLLRILWVPSTPGQRRMLRTSIEATNFYIKTNTDSYQPRSLVIAVHSSNVPKRIRHSHVCPGPSGRVAPSAWRIEGAKHSRFKIRKSRSLRKQIWKHGYHTNQTQNKQTVENSNVWIPRNQNYFQNVKIFKCLCFKHFRS